MSSLFVKNLYALKMNTDLLVLLILIAIAILIVLYVNRSHETKKPCSAVRTSSHLVKADYKQAIPFNIIQINDEVDVPCEMLKSISTITAMNPEYQHLYYDVAGRRMFLQKNFEGLIVDVYDQMSPGEYQSTLFRYCVLYKTGGVYFNNSVSPLVSLKEILKETDQFVTAENSGSGWLYDGFIAVAPGHPILEAAIDRIVANVTSRSTGVNGLDVDGSTLLASVFEEYTGSKALPNLTYMRDGSVRLLSYVGGGTEGQCSVSGVIKADDVDVFTS